MIFYFSGTGNSYSVAKEVAERTDEKMINIAEAWRNKQFSYTIAEGENIGVVYPIHAWAPPTLVLRFIKKLQLSSSNNTYVYSILTCGDNWEGAVEKIRHAYARIGLTLQGDYQVIMPDCYVVGRQVNSPDIAKKKLVASIEVVDRVIDDIQAKKDNYRPIKYSIFKSHIIYRFFQLGKLFPIFRTSNACVGCGLCAKACPMHVIRMKNKRSKDHRVPSWKEGCVQCNACINICPKKAIDYIGAEKEIRYINPIYKKDFFQNIAKHQD